MKLNENALRRCRVMIDATEELRLSVHRYPDGVQVIDCGIHARGGLEAGRFLAEVCMAGLGRAKFAAEASRPWHVPAVAVRTDQPLTACMACQYAGWRIGMGGYFAMASGPMRGLALKEPLFDRIGRPEAEPVAVGVLEASSLPPEEVCRHLAAQCHVAPDNLTLLVARTASQAGTVQVVARSVETAMHKLSELGFDLAMVESGYGVAPLPPMAKDDLAAMGRTNDAILYGAEVTLWLRGDLDRIVTIGPRIPSIASPDYGRPFVEIFERYGRDFYRIDPTLFGPAVVNLFHLDSGRSFRFGRMLPDVLEESFHAE